MVFVWPCYNYYERVRFYRAAGICLAEDYHFTDVRACQVIFLNHRGDQASILSLNALIRHRKHQTNRSRPCVPSASKQPVHKTDRCPPDVLVIPTRPVSRISDLTSHELSSLMESVKTVGSIVEKAYSGDGLTVACQVRRSLTYCPKRSKLTIHLL